jgi:predicted dehydrogenase
MDPPRRYMLVPSEVPSGSAFNVAQAYARFAASEGDYHPDFEDAVRRHALIDAIERSSAEGRAVQVQVPSLTGTSH